ncbi:L-pipecolate oxidase [Diaporthe amygdali]|uniref:L-pipecolate oxidase n=1 Tax=Phomopsis amygdali TaxID=1214568 RepID=UPI0022FF3B01|nr:L-pipecolate oxidase [Diaporthe amygdali]KAJ0106978.1 L-pipecolate oxidase [Diaporthe amygdali]
MAASPNLHPSSKIFIIGSGVFGLSTALWLARSGYTDVTVLDMQDTARAGYDPDEIDSASADINKIIRFSYGTEIEYQRLASDAAVMWEEWNQQLARAKDEDLPPGLRDWAGERKLWWNVGMLRMSATDDFGDFEMRTLENMEKEGLRDRQFKSDDAADLERAKERGWAHKLDPCDREVRFGVHKAVLDSTAGYVLAYKSCAWARHLAEKAGVRFVLDAEKGRVVKIDEQSGKPRVTTADGTIHEADVLVVACGGWTPSLLPELSHLLETTAGSVATIKIPKSNVELWDRFSPQNFPVVTWGMKEGMGIYSFPRDENGIIKIGYRATKYTNFDEVDGRRISVPKTAHVTECKETNVPLKSLQGIKDYINHALPSLAPLGISSTKLCWYTDSIDNSFLISYLPDKPDDSRSKILVCSGGSGHGFKFLPILGQQVVKILESRTEGNVYADMWAWREAQKGGKRNGLEEGENGPRVLAKQTMASEKDWVLQ